MKMIEIMVYEIIDNYNIYIFQYIFDIGFYSSNSNFYQIQKSK